MIEDTLKQLNLSEKEIKTYLTLLKLGSSSINRISEITALPKSTCYDILRGLISRGLASSLIREKVKYFEATNPQVLITQLDEKKKKIKQILPELNSMYKTVGEKPQVHLYEGKTGLKMIYDKVLSTRKDFLIFGNYTLFAQFFKWFYAQFIKRRIKSGIPAYIISDSSKFAKAMRKKDKQENRKSKITTFMDDQKAECYVFGDHVAFVTLSEKEPVGVVIQNHEISHLMRSIFKEVWKK